MRTRHSFWWTSVVVVLSVSMSGCARSDVEDPPTPRAVAQADPQDQVDAARDDRVEADHRDQGDGNTQEEVESDADRPDSGDANNTVIVPAIDPDADTPTLPDEAHFPEEGGLGTEDDYSDPEFQEPPKQLDPPEGARRLDAEYDVWIDPERRAVILDGFVVFREGPLEMFACTRGTKEHESIVSVNTKAFLAHAALLNVGAESGTPVQFVPEFRPPTGTQIEIEVLWEDEQGERHTARAQDWIRDVRTQQSMEHPWVFAGSMFWKDEETGVSHYQAEAGDFICVSNFASAMLDIPVESTQANEGLMFEAFTERIPPLGTHVRLILSPVLEEPEEEEEMEERSDEEADALRP